MNLPVQIHLFQGLNSEQECLPKQPTYSLHKKAKGEKNVSG